MPEGKNDNSNEKKEKKRNRTLTITLAAIVLVTIVGLLGLFIGRYSAQSTSEAPQNFVSYPTVSTSVASSADGKSHTIDIDLVVEYADGRQASVSHDAVHGEMTSAISSLDYEQLKRADSVERIEQSVKGKLDAFAGEGNIARVYVCNIAIDFPGVVDSTQTDQSRSNQRVKGLFRNIQD